MSLSITHAAAEGTLIDGTARGDGSAEILKRNGWRWGASIRCWYIPRSRDRAARRREIDSTAEQLREAGFIVDVTIDDTYRSAADVEATTAARQEERATRLDASAERKSTAAEAADAAARRAHEALPPMGEPIKVGHHSEGRHRSAIARADASMRRSIDADEDAKRAQERAAIAAAAADQHNAPVRVANRVDRLERELARWERQRDGSSRRLAGGYVEETPPATGGWAERVGREIERCTDELEYWRSVRRAQIDAGIVIDHSAKTIKPGDRIRYSGVWATVLRCNPKTVSATCELFGKFNVPYTHIVEHRPATTDGGAL